MKLKSIYGIIPRIKNMVKFRVERFILGGAKNQLLIIALVILVIAIVSGYIHYRLYPETGLGDAVWWAFLRLTDPGYLGDDQGTARRVISTIVTVLGYVVFLGSLVAIMTQWFTRVMKDLEMGLTRIYHRGHILIIGWSSKTPIMVREILLSEERVSNFLRMIKKGRLNIVILSEEVSPRIVNDLKTGLKHLWERRLVTFRSGIPLKIDHLDRVDFLHAGVIILPGAEIYEDLSRSSDTNIVKTLMTMSHYAEERGVACPDCVTEITDPDKISVLLSSYGGRLDVISGGLITARLMAQVMRHRGLSHVFHELLKNEGNEIYIRSARGYGGIPFKDMRKAFSKSILMGVMRPEGSRVLSIMNPDPSMEILPDDDLVLLAEEYDTSGPDIEVQQVDLNQYMFKTVKRKKARKKILVIGWNRIVPLLISELGTYGDEKYSVDIFSIAPVAERESATGKPGSKKTGVKIKHILGDPTGAADIAGISPGDYDNIIIVASDRAESGEESDARTIMAFMFLQELFHKKSKSPHTIVELHDPDNSILFKDRDCEVIIPSHIISYTLTQIALKRKLRIIYDRLFSSKGADIMMREAGSYGIPDREMLFDEIEDHVYGFGDIVIGVKIKTRAPSSGEYILNPPKDSIFRFSPGDELIVIGR